MPKLRSLPLIVSFVACALSLAALALTIADRWRPEPLVQGPGEPLAAVGPQLMFPALEDPEGMHVNHSIALAHNWDWSLTRGWQRGDGTQPSVAVVLESWYRGLGELNFDMRPPAGYTDWRGGRALGLAARYDGAFAILSVGGEPYSPGGAGVQIVGGHTLDPIMTLFEAEQAPERAALRVQRRDNSASVSLRGGLRPGLAFGLDEQPAESGDGVLQFSGRTRDPILAVRGAGSDATLIASRPADNDAQPRLRVSADGQFEWGDGALPHDIALRRAERGRLAVDGELLVSSLRVGAGAPLQALQILTATVAPGEVPANGARDTVVSLPGLSATSSVFVSGPEQPQGLGMVTARAGGADTLVLRFTNASDRPIRPAEGVYTILAVEPSER